MGYQGDEQRECEKESKVCQNRLEKSESEGEREGSDDEDNEDEDNENKYKDLSHKL